MDADEILKVCALSRLNAPETKAEHHAYTTARQTLSSLVERIGNSDRSREPGSAPEGADTTPADPSPAAAPAGGEELRVDEPRPDDLADCLAEVAPEIRARLLLVPPIL